MSNFKIYSLIRCAENILKSSLDDSRSPELDASLLMRAVLACSREELLMNMRMSVEDEAASKYASLVERRAIGEPVAYIMGEKEFMSLKFRVDHRCLIPRPETELLVEKTLEFIGSSRLSVLDLGSGSGCIAISLLKFSSGISVVASDISLSALEVAKKNAEIHGVFDYIEFVEGDLFKPFENRKFDVIVSNPPYIDIEESLPSSVKHFEPFRALFSPWGGLRIPYEIIDKSPFFLNSGGALFMEIHSAKAGLITERFRRAGFSDVTVWKDIAGLDRVVSGINKW